jgi:hypothetical protein
VPELAPIHLTLLMGPQIPVPVPQPVTDALLSAQVTVTAGQRSGFQLGFDLSTTGLINTTLLPTGFLDPRTRVILVATVRGTPTVLMATCWSSRRCSVRAPARRPTPTRTTARRYGSSRSRPAWTGSTTSRSSR